jgi:hypothetical protein
LSAVEPDDLSVITVHPPPEEIAEEENDSVNSQQQKLDRGTSTRDSGVSRPFCDANEGLSDCPGDSEISAANDASGFEADGCNRRRTVSDSEVASRQNDTSSIRSSSIPDADRITPSNKTSQRMVEESGRTVACVAEFGVGTEFERNVGLGVSNWSASDEGCAKTYGRENNRIKIDECCPSPVKPPSCMNGSSCLTDTSLAGVKVRARGQSSSSLSSSPKEYNVGSNTSYNESVCDKSIRQNASHDTCSWLHSIDYRPLPAPTEMTSDKGATSVKTVLSNGSPSMHLNKEADYDACGHSACDVRLTENDSAISAENSPNIANSADKDLFFQWLGR